MTQVEVGKGAGEWVFAAVWGMGLAWQALVSHADDAWDQ
jgi:hypothetical protein